MIPDVTRQVLIDALQRFDAESRPQSEWADWEEQRRDRDAIEFEGRRYPLRHIVWLASGRQPFPGNVEATRLVGELGFTVRSLAVPAAAAPPGEPPLRWTLQQIVKGFGEARQLAAFSSKHEQHQRFTQLAALLQESAPVARRPYLEVVAGPGQGSWARVPRVVLLDPRVARGPQHGLHVALLFRYDLSGVYLALRLGTEEVRKALMPKGRREAMEQELGALRALAAPLRRAGFALDDGVDLRLPEGGAEQVRSVVAHRFHDAAALPDDGTWLAELDAALQAYEAMSAALPGLAAPEPAQAAQELSLAAWSGEAGLAEWEADAAITWPADELGDLRRFASPDDLKAAVRGRHGPLYAAEAAAEPEVDVARWDARWALAHARPGDRVVARAGTRALAGTLAGPYQFIGLPPGPHHRVPVKWESDARAGTGLAAAAEGFIAALRDAELDFGEGHARLGRAFLAALCTKRFAILTGLSGSGKTQLALRLGDFLGAERTLVLPVRPDWTGPEALLGYEDALQPPLPDGRRPWRVPDALAFLRRAALDPSQPYLLVLDEMNLAHVERYLADLLSGMESDAPCVPAIERAADGRWAVREGERWPMPKNLFVVGTVNVDETTHPFSPKVLDRAHTFELRVATQDLRLTPRRPHAAARGKPAWLRALSDASQREAALQPAGVIEPLAQFLRVAHALLTEAGLEFGHRVFHESLRFAALHAAMGEPSADVALDEVLMQKVLVRLQGSRRQLEGLLDALGRLCVDPATPDPWRGADPFAPPVSPRLARSHRKLAQLRRSLREQPYAHYFG